MIKVTVNLENDYDSKYKEIEITKEEIKQLACNKAKGMYIDGTWEKITAEDEIEVKSNF